MTELSPNEINRRWMEAVARLLGVQTLLGPAQKPTVNEWLRAEVSGQAVQVLAKCAFDMQLVALRGGDPGDAAEWLLAFCVRAQEWGRLLATMEASI